jgi:hypothetical protein
MLHTAFRDGAAPLNTMQREPYHTLDVEEDGGTWPALVLIYLAANTRIHSPASVRTGTTTRISILRHPQL